MSTNTEHNDPGQGWHLAFKGTSESYIIVVSLFDIFPSINMFRFKALQASAPLPLTCAALINILVSMCSGYFIYLSIYLFIYLFIYFVHSFIHLFICSFVHLFIYLFSCLFIHSFIHFFVRSFVRSFIHSFIHFYLFIYLFIYLCIGGGGAKFREY